MGWGFPIKWVRRLAMFFLQNSLYRHFGDSLDQEKSLRSGPWSPHSFINQGRVVRGKP